jgi:hypothetical protein
MVGVDSSTVLSTEEGFMRQSLVPWCLRPQHRVTSPQGFMSLGVRGKRAIQNILEGLVEYGS